MDGNVIQQIGNFVFPPKGRCLHFCIIKWFKRPGKTFTQMAIRLFTLFAMILSLARLQAQGWEAIYGGSGQDVARGIARTADGGYVVTGYYNANSRLFLFKIDADGNLQWSRTYTGGAPSARIEGAGVAVDSEGNILVAGYVDADGTSGPLQRDIYLMKTDPFGAKIWEKTYGDNLIEEALSIVRLDDGNLILTGIQHKPANKQNVFVMKTDADGTVQWLNNYGNDEYRKQGNGIAISPDGDILVAGESQSTAIADRQAYVLHLKSDGSLVGEQTYGTAEDEIASTIEFSPDGNLVVGGFSNSVPGGAGYLLKITPGLNASPIWERFFNGTDINDLAIETGGNLLLTGHRVTGVLEDLSIIKTDAQGNIIWEARNSHGGFSGGNAIIAHRGGAVAAGYSELTIGAIGQSYACVIKADANGKVLTSYIEANVFRDFNGNCQKEADETGLRNWVVRFEGTNDTIYTVANANGDIRLPVDTGSYNLVLFPPNTYWKPCDQVITVDVPDYFDTVYTSIPVRTQFDCARNEIDIAAPILRRCTDNTYRVRYCNSGTVPSFNTLVSVILDPGLQFVSSSVAPQSISGDTVFFNIGTLNNADCGEFSLTAFLDCNTITGQTHCVTAFIAPNSFCDINPAWDGSIISAQALCENDSVKMMLTNVGADMNGPLGYVIAEDVIMLTQPNDPDFRFQLNAGKDSVVWSRPANGSTFRIIAQQSPGYPGYSYPTAAVEGCISDTSNADISLGFYTMFPEDDGDVFKETDCQESYNADYNPTYLKRGHPKGYDVAHNYISPKTDLDYLIQFRNTGADTVRQVIIRDTLSAALDPATVYPGVCSHPFDFVVYGGGIVQFTLQNINLPPGGGAESEGFVKFRVSQKQNLPCESKILNSAAVYFDFNQPGFTDTTLHTVCEFDSFVVVTSIRETIMPGVEVRTFPNPMVASITFEVSGTDAEKYELQLFDALGKNVHSQSFSVPTFQLFRRQLPTGAFHYRVSADGLPVATGTIIVR